MAITSGRGEGQSCSDINMTPLIDVMLVLLIIFIITIPTQTHAIKIDNPAGPPPLKKPDVIDLLIDFDGSLFWNKKPVDRATLAAYIDQSALRRPAPEVHIAVDKFARYEIVAQTLADLQRRGLSKIGFINGDYIQ
jgi:biopolymer transport protein ExbD